MKRIFSGESPSLYISRRRALGTIGVALAAAPFVELLGSSRAIAGPAASKSGNWATGGTKSMTGNYPDPFASGLGAACALTCGATAGPCYAATLTRKDISEGHGGLPVRLAFLVVDERCKPVSNASVDIWHCGPEGLYSANDASGFCTRDDAAARAARWFRGLQTTDGKGRVDFDTCFPGWYGGRTIHIHATVRVGGNQLVTTQFVFDDALGDEIVRTQPLYNTRGPRDTKNTNDGVMSGAKIADYTFQTARMADGVMVASKTIVIRSSGKSSCSMGMGPR